MSSTEGVVEVKVGDSGLLSGSGAAVSLESWQICVLGNVQTCFIH